MNKPSEEDIKFAEEISSYSPNKITDVMKTDNEALQRYIEGNAQYLGGRPALMEVNSSSSNATDADSSTGFTARSAGYGIFILAVGAIFAGLLPMVTFQGKGGDNLYSNWGMMIHIHLFHFYFMVIGLLGINGVINSLKGWTTPAVIAVSLILMVLIFTSLTGGLKVGLGFIVLIVIYLLILVVPLFVNSKVEN